MDFSQLGELIDIKPRAGSLFIRSQSEPFEEGDVQEKVLNKWLESFKFEPIVPAHASGHASRDEVFEVVRRIAPRIVIPVHTEHPEMFEGKAPKVILANPEEPFVIDGS
ncbi:MAG: MBL fold metallo-hydrolase RNA specificity domain-containing protein, partial [Thermoplasmata archaeon]